MFLLTWNLLCLHTINFMFTHNFFVNKKSCFHVNMKKNVLLKLLYHWTKPFNDLNNFCFGFPNEFWDPKIWTLCVCHGFYYDYVGKHHPPRGSNSDTMAIETLSWSNTMVEHATQRRRPPHRHPSRHVNPKPSPGRHRPLPQVAKKTLHWGSDRIHGIVVWAAFLNPKPKSEAPQRKSRPHVPTQISMRRPPHPNHTHTSITRIRWTSARPRDNGRPADTQTDTHTRSPRQDTTDHCLTSRRRRCAQEVAEVTVSLHELYSWN